MENQRKYFVSSNHFFNFKFFIYNDKTDIPVNTKRSLTASNVFTANFNLKNDVLKSYFIYASPYIIPHILSNHHKDF
jgi:hypothetical protein